MQYDVVRNERLIGLVDYINTFIKDGWQPLGGLAISANEKYGTEYHQAIVKYDAVELHTDWRAYLNALAEHFEDTKGFEVPEKEGD